jgi:hypothetical protein
MSAAHLVPIPAGTPETACRSCRTPVYFVTHHRTKNLLPVEVNAALDLRCRRPTHDTWGQGISHFASCPQRAQWSKKGKTAAARAAS